MKKVILAFLVVLSLSAKSQNLVSATPIDTIAAGLLNFVASGLAKYDVVTYKVLYTSVDATGAPVTLSGAFCLPLNSGCDSLAIAAYAHGTVLSKANVPSRNNTEATLGKVAASRGYVAVMPDYLGLGDSPGFHPYLHAQTQATATLDAITATRQYITDSTSGYTLNGEVLFTGYSQGGHACMATVKYIQDNNLESTFNIIAAAPASGPYDLAGSTAETVVNDVSYSNPGYVVYILFGMNEVYGNIFNTPADILKSPYDVQVPPLLTGQNTLADLNAVLPAKASQFLEDTVLAAFIGDTVGQTHPIWQALNANANFDWTPNFPLRMYYCTQDEQVDFSNSLTALAAMQSNGALNVKAINGGPFTHGGCVLPSISGAALFFDTVSTSCANNDVSLLEKAWASLVMYPNPANHQIQFSGLPAHESIAGLIYNGSGQLLKRFEVTGSQPVNVSQLKKGMYYLSLLHQGQELKLRLLID